MCKNIHQHILSHLSFKNFLIIICCLLHSYQGCAQTVNFEDGFEDRDFTSNPVWTGDGSQFSVIKRSSNYLLQLQGDNSSGGVSYLSTPSTNTVGSWEIYINLDGFPPSNGNHADIFLMYDTKNLKNSGNGYALRAGERGSSDVFKIVRYDKGSEAATILSGTTNISSGGAYRVKVTRQAGGVWQLAVGDGYEGTLIKEGGSQTDNTYTASAYFGIRVTYSSTRWNKFLFDCKINLPPFTIKQVKAHTNEVDVTFSRAYDHSTVQPSDFSIDHGLGVPASISFINITTVRLNYADSFSSNKYALTINHIDDNNGETIVPNSVSTFFIFGDVNNKDVIINEFIYDPPPGSVEYTELKNTSGEYLNLQSWELGDETGINEISTDPIVLYPDSFLVVANDTTTLFNTFGHRSYIQMESFPLLNNDEDVIKLTTDSGLTADSLKYTSGWGGDNMALERRSDSVSSIYSENWADSPHSKGGTPGTENKIAKDTTSPTLTDIEIIDNQTLELNFDERLERTSAENTLNYTISGSIAINSATISPAAVVTLTLSDRLLNAVSYTLNINDVEDIFGNALTHNNSAFTYYQISSVDSADIFVNEFTYDPPDNGTEYIELYNPTSKSLDLNGWTLNDNTHTKHFLTSGQFILPPDSRVVIAPDNTLLTDYPGISLITMRSNFPSLNNGGDQIVIRDSSGILLDSLAYSTSWGGSGVALERKTTSVAATALSNWGNAPNNFGTPGQYNEIARDNTPPEISGFTATDSISLRLVFDEPLDQHSARATSSYKLSGGIDIDSIYDVSSDTVHLSLGSALQNAKTYTLSVGGVEDLFSNTLRRQDTTFIFYQVSSADSSDIFINEFTYDPPTGSTEYIELYNPTAKSLNLQNWTLNDNTGNQKTITRSRLVIPPDSFAVLAPDKTLLKTYPHILLVSMNDDFPSLNNSGDGIVVRDAKGMLLDSLTYTSRWGANQISTERKTTSVAGTYYENWGKAQNGLGTPGSSNDIVPDKKPPNLSSIDIKGNTTMQLVFDETPDKYSVSAISNYELSGEIHVVSTAVISGNTVQLSLEPALKNTVTYTLTINGIEDIFGNTLSERDTTFTYYKITAADSGDIVVNEFMYDPPAGESEYVELDNSSSKSLDIKGWTLNDNTGTRSAITSSQFVMPPHSFVVVTPDRTLQKKYPNIHLITMGSKFPTLNQSGDDIVIRSAGGLLIDSLKYTSGWGGDNVALERKTSATSGTYHENWGKAPSGFGTPGTANDIPRDTDPPELNQLRISGKKSIQLLFSERLEPNSASMRSNYFISPSKKIRLVSVQNDSVILFLSDSLRSEQNYRITVENLSDIFGNRLDTTTLEDTYIKFSTVDAGDIVINEILYNKTTDGPGFVELYNTSDKNFNLSGWKIGDASVSASLDEDIHLKAKDFLVLTGNTHFMQSLSNAQYIPGFPSLNNNGDAVYVRDNTGFTVDSLYYSSAWIEDSKGISIERRDPAAASNDPSNWQKSTASKGFSAGIKNASYEPDKTAPEVLFSKVLTNGNIEVRFSEFIKLTSSLNFSLQDRPLHVTTFDPENGNIIILIPSKIKTNGPSGTVKIEHISDVKGNVTSSAKIAIAQQPAPEDVVINEIMFNPLDDADDNRPDQSEYIELRNTRDYAISLEGFCLHDAPNEKGDVRLLVPVNTTAKWLPAQSVALIYADETSSFSQSRIENFFKVQNPHSSSLIRIDRSTLSLAASDDAVYIADSTGLTIDSVYYDESWHNPNLIDNRGIALERISPGGPSNDKSNWSSSTNSRGGTPDRENSIFQTPENMPQQTGISFATNPFSPDNDGYEDHLFINYKLDESDYLIKVRIYDRYGRLIRKLADGKPAGFEGNVIWDGLKGNGTKNRIGIYIVVFQAYNSAEGKDCDFKKTVVLARRLN